MAYIIQRKDRFYVVAYDGLDPLTGKERRRWGMPPAATATKPSRWPHASTATTPGLHRPEEVQPCSVSS